MAFTNKQDYGYDKSDILAPEIVGQHVASLTTIE